MMRRRRAGAFLGLLAASGALAACGAGSPGSGTAARQWTEKDLRGSVQLAGEVPLSVAQGKATLIGHHDPGATIKLNFGFPIADKAGLDRLIAQESTTHSYISRDELYARFTPPAEQEQALESWLTSQGLTVIHAGADRMAVGVQGTTAQVEKALHVTINDYMHPATTIDGIKVAPYAYYANTTNPTVPARYGLQTVSGLNNVDRFFTNAQLKAHSANPPFTPEPVVKPRSKGLGEGADTRSGGYWPGDVRSLYDVKGFDGTGQTLGFTLWGAGERQPAMNRFASDTGDTPITVDPDCVATRTQPSDVATNCTNLQVQGDHLVTILENGNTANASNLYASNVETALDIEQAHGIATHAAMKYYDADCAADPTPGSGNGDSDCNGSDVGLEEAVEDAAADPTLHTVSNSWGYGGEAEWGAADPVSINFNNSFALAAAAGTTFWFSTGDFGTYFSGFPADSPYVAAVGGTTAFSTSDPTKLSTEEAWAAGGSWCSNIVARPSWQNVAAVNSAAPCPGRVIPDISAVADTNSAVHVVASGGNSASGVQGGVILSGSVGGTSVAAPELNGMAAVLENYVAAQTYSGAKPKIGFVAPMLYTLGANADRYYRDVQCGNTAYPTGSVNGDAAQPGWDPATGWGAPDWQHFAAGYAIALGASNVSQPSSLATHFAFNCAKTPTNAAERALSFPSSTVGYSLGATNSSTWLAPPVSNFSANYFQGGSWGAGATILKTADSGRTWTPSNSDMLSIACTSATACVEVGDGGRAKTTTDGGTTWTDATTGFDKTLSSVQCPAGGTTCYAAGDRGNVFKSTNSGRTWTHLNSTASNPIYGLSCPTANVCYASDLYAHIVKTADGGATWTWQKTPVTTPGIDVPGSGGPNPFAGLFGITCTDANTCVAVGGYPPAGTDAPIVTTTDGGTTWMLRTSNAGVNGSVDNHLHGVASAGGTFYAVGNNGTIVTSADGGATWTKMASGTTAALNGIACQSATSCIATGSGGTIDVLDGTTWTPTTGNGNGAFLTSVTCPAANNCFATGRQGTTLHTADGTTWTQQAGGGSTQQMNGISCPSTSTCFAVGNGGTILATTNSGQTWLVQTSGTTSTLSAISCTSATACVATGAAGVVRYTTNGSTWSAGTSGTANALNGVSCAAACTAVGAAGTIVSSTDGGATWTAQTSGTAAALNAVNCQGSTCYAAGAVSGGSAVIVKGVAGTWTAQTSNAPQALTGISCLDASNCFAGGAIGTVVTTTDGGNHWAQQGNPISGSTAALNSGPTGITAINAAACNTNRCDLGMASSGDILTTQLLHVAVKGGTPFANSPAATFQASDPALVTTPSVPAGTLSGTLSCTVDHPVGSGGTGSSTVSNCSGLSADGYSVVIDYANSAVTFPQGQTTVGGDVPAMLSLTLGAAPTFPSLVAGVAHDYLASTTAGITSSAGDATLTVADPGATAPGHLVNGAFSLPQALQVAAGNAAFAPLPGNSPLTLMAWNAPVTGDVESINFKQSIGSSDPLRTGTYVKTLTFTLSTTNP